MASKVAARPNHYQLLGLDPTASANEIAEAFTRGLRQPHTLGGVGLLSVAYQTLRDPAKRRAYDTEIGVRRPETPQPVVGHWQTARPVAVPAPRTPAPAPPVRPSEKPAAQSDLPSFLAASLRNIARPEPLDASRRSEPEPPTPFEAAPAVDPAPSKPVIAIMPPPVGPRFEEAEEGAIAWKRPAAAVAALVAVAGLTGVWAGWESSNDVAPPPAQAVAKAYLPPARPLPKTVAEGAPLVPAATEAQVEPAVAQTIAALAAAPPTPTQPSVRAVAQAEPEPAPVSAVVTEADPLAPSPAAEAAPDAAQSTRVAALPLSNRTVARTIERIGYACGQVASAMAVEGASGVFKVNCTSGQSYQARPVGGRYHFRRWGRS